MQVKLKSFLYTFLFISLIFPFHISADGPFTTKQLLNLQIKLSHSENGLLTGTQKLQITFIGNKIEDNSSFTFNPQTKAENTPLVKDVIFKDGIGNIEIPILSSLNETEHNSFGIDQFKNLKVRIALNESPSDFIEIPFSSSLYAIQSMKAEQLAGNIVTIDKENNLAKIKKIQLSDDSYTISNKRDIVSVGNGLSINSSNKVSIIQPTPLPDQNPYLQYNIENNTIDWVIIPGLEGATYKASTGLVLNVDTFKISTANVVGDLDSGHLFTWDKDNDRPEWKALEVEDGITVSGSKVGIGDEIKIGTAAGDTGKIRFNDTSNNFEGFTGETWEVLNK